MSEFLQILDEGEVCMNLSTALLLLWVGHSFADQGQRQLGARFAGFILVAYVLYKLLSSPPNDAEDLFSLTVRALVVAALATGAAWVVIPPVTLIWRFCYRVLWESPKQKLTTAQSRRRERQAEQTRIKNESHLRRRQQETGEQQTAAAREREEKERQEQLRRENARLECENLFSLLESALQDRFARSAFDAYVSRYLGDSVPAEVVEQRAVTFRQLLVQHRDGPGPKGKQSSIEKLAGWYEEQKALVQGLTVDEDMKEDMLRSLAERFDEKMKHHLEELDT